MRYDRLGMFFVHPRERGKFTSGHLCHTVGGCFGLLNEMPAFELRGGVPPRHIVGITAWMSSRSSTPQPISSASCAMHNVDAAPSSSAGEGGKSAARRPDLDGVPHGIRLWPARLRPCPPAPSPGPLWSTWSRTGRQSLPAGSWSAPSSGSPAVPASW